MLSFWNDVNGFVFIEYLGDLALNEVALVAVRWRTQNILLHVRGAIGPLGAEQVCVRFWSLPRTARHLSLALTVWVISVVNELRREKEFLRILLLL